MEGRLKETAKAMIRKNGRKKKKAERTVTKGQWEERCVGRNRNEETTIYRVRFGHAGPNSSLFNDKQRTTHADVTTVGRKRQQNMS